MNSVKQTCIFGPIPSRRLGISLGMDLVPFKTCSMDCIYCECGKTTDLTTERKEYFPTGRALEQIDAALDRHPDIDYITFSGTGEPTLHSGIGVIIGRCKSMGFSGGEVAATNMNERVKKIFMVSGLQKLIRVDTV